MTIRHHPSDETLAAFAANLLDEANTLVVATHLSLCPDCRTGVRQFEALAGHLLETMSVESHGTVRLPAVADLERRPSPAPTQAVIPGSRLVSSPAAARSPVSLYDSGDWRWIGVGVQWKPVAMPAEDDTKVFLLKAAPGTRLPDHRHTGTEWTCVLEGAFSHDFGVFGPGDFDEADETVEHRPFVERRGPCICLVALNGRIELTSWIGRMLQPLVRM